MNWMERYASPEDASCLCRHVHRGGGVSLVTDTRCLLVADDPAATFDDLAIDPKAAPVVTAFRYAAPPTDALWADLYDLWRWLDRVERLVCPGCRGTGHYGPLGEGGEAFTCSECDGNRWVFPVPDRPDGDTVVVCGRHLDRNRVAWWLAGELADLGTACRAWAVEGAAGVPAVMIAGERWRLVVSSMRPETHRGRHRSYHPGAGTWWASRRCETSQCASIDWAQEQGVDPGALFPEYVPEGAFA